MKDPLKNKENKKLGRPKLKKARSSFTTSLELNNKKKLEVLASIRGQRKADVLNEILEYYFENIIEGKEKKLLDTL